jgi:hypothetical protein
MLGHLHDAGNATTLAHRLELLSAAGTVTGLAKYSDGRVRQPGSSPRLAVLNTALLSAATRVDPAEAGEDHRGRLAESAVGARLANAAGL